MNSLFAKLGCTVRRIVQRAEWRNLRTLHPVSKVFALDRGTPIDRVYIEDFLRSNRPFIRGVVCEIASNDYCSKFGSYVERFEILSYDQDNRNATIIGDLTDVATLPNASIDCFVLTQTLNFIYDFQSAIEGVHFMLKTGGVVLATVSGISQISRYDMDRWGDYWRFTELSIKKSFETVFGFDNVVIETYGNVLSSIAFLEGISAEELTRDELFYRDKDYQMTIAVRAVKR